MFSLSLRTELKTPEHLPSYLVKSLYYSMSQKAIRGSAIIDDSGQFLFHPYNSNPTENSPWRVITATESGVVKETNEVISIRLTIPRTPNVKANVSSFMRRFADIITSYESAQEKKQRKARCDT